MKNNDPILLFRESSIECGPNVQLTYSLSSGMHAQADGKDTGSLQPLSTNSMQTKTREAIDTVENSEL